MVGARFFVYLLPHWPFALIDSKGGLPSCCLNVCSNRR